VRQGKLFNLVGGLFLVLVAALLATAARQPAAAAGSDGIDKVEDLVLRQLAEKGEADFFVWFADKADLSPAGQLEAKTEKGQFVFDALRATAQRTQHDLRTYLDAQGVDYWPFYIANRVWIMRGSEALLRELAVRADVARITANHTLQLDEPIDTTPSDAGPNYVEPNLLFVKVDQVWAMGVTGQGMVLADDNTGLDYTHPAIATHYRGCVDPPACTTWDHNYAWWDAWGDSPDVPWDDFGLGTHSAGIMVGDDLAGNQIGMAPGARLIACKNTQNGGGNDAHVLICFEWNLAPWDLDGADPRPDLAPDVLNNSWGYWPGGTNTFHEAVDNLLAAGIAVEASAGDDGPACQSLRSPGDYE
jgi:subtilisin family serine protease